MIAPKKKNIIISDKGENFENSGISYLENGSANHQFFYKTGNFLNNNQSTIHHFKKVFKSTEAGGINSILSYMLRIKM